MFSLQEFLNKKDTTQLDMPNENKLPIIYRSIITEGAQTSYNYEQAKIISVSKDYLLKIKEIELPDNIKLLNNITNNYAPALTEIAVKLLNNLKTKPDSYAQTFLEDLLELDVQGIRAITPTYIGDYKIPPEISDETQIPIVINLINNPQKIIQQRVTPAKLQKALFNFAEDMGYKFLEELKKGSNAETINFIEINDKINLSLENYKIITSLLLPNIIEETQKMINQNMEKKELEKLVFGFSEAHVIVGFNSKINCLKNDVLKYHDLLSKILGPQDEIESINFNQLIR
jgi:hypothetical protein